MCLQKVVVSNEKKFTALALVVRGQQGGPNIFNRPRFDELIHHGQSCVKMRAQLLERRRQLRTAPAPPLRAPVPLYAVSRALTEPGTPPPEVWRTAAALQTEIMAAKLQGAPIVSPRHTATAAAGGGGGGFGAAAAACSPEQQHEQQQHEQQRQRQRGGLTGVLNALDDSLAALPKPPRRRIPESPPPSPSSPLPSALQRSLASADPPPPHALTASSSPLSSGGGAPGAKRAGGACHRPNVHEHGELGELGECSPRNGSLARALAKKVDVHVRGRDAVWPSMGSGNDDGGGATQWEGCVVAGDGRGSRV